MRGVFNHETYETHEKIPKIPNTENHPVVSRARHSVRAAASNRYLERRARRSDAPYQVTRFGCHGTGLLGAGLIAGTANEKVRNESSSAALLLRSNSILTVDELMAFAAVPPTKPPFHPKLQGSMRTAPELLAAG